MELKMCTKIKVNRLKVTWDILNFSLNGKNMGECITSYLCTFTLASKVNLPCFLGLYPKGKTNDDRDFVSLFLFTREPSPKMEIQYSFAILDSKGNEVNKYQEVTIIKEMFTLGTHKFISISDIKKYLINDNLTIVSTIRAGVNIIQMPLLHELTRKPSDKLSRDFQILFENQKFTDVILYVKGKTFNAHKAILSTRSSVFSALFEHEMQENINSRVDIEDAEPNVVEEMLRFIYTGKVNDLNLIACVLLEISDKYFLEELKLICEDNLCQSLSVENVLKILSLADLHNAQRLKTKAVEFSITHANKIIQTAAFKSSENLNAHIFIDLFKAFALKQDT